MLVLTSLSRVFFQILLVPVGDQESRVSLASGGPGEQGLARQRHLVAEGEAGCEQGGLARWVLPRQRSCV